MRIDSGVARAVAVAACLAAVGLGTAAFPSVVGSSRALQPNALYDNVSIMATSALSFVPSSFSVHPGASVTLKITQEASFTHWFNLSSVANATIPSGDSKSQVESYFANQTPLGEKNLSSTRGIVSTLSFTAPPVGTYEFVCPLHFSSGMTGIMTSTTGSSAPPTAIPITPLDLAIIGGVLIAIVAVLVVVLRPGRLAREERRQEIDRSSARRRRQQRY